MEGSGLPVYSDIFNRTKMLKCQWLSGGEGRLGILGQAPVITEHRRLQTLAQTVRGPYILHH